MTHVRLRAGATLPVAVLLMISAGCGDHRSVLAPIDGPPVLKVEAKRAGLPGRTTSSYQIHWTAASGRADHYLYAVNPTSLSRVDKTWITTGSTSFELAVPRGQTDLALSRESRLPKAVTFAVIAEDASGRRSDVKYLSFVGDNIAPTVQITSPVPSSLTKSSVPPSIEIHWEGFDPDGGTSQVPMQYKFKLLGPGSEFPIATALVNPDSLRRFYEPRGYAGWDSTGGCCPSAKLSDLVPGQDYLFVVVAEDLLGAYTQVFSLNTNMLSMRCTLEFSSGPILTLYNSSFSYTYPVATYSTDPAYQVPLAVPAGVPVTVNWSGTPQPGASIFWYRWALDIADVTDETPRVNEATDLSHWSQRSASTTSATVGPFRAGETHLLYVEANDTNGLRSLGMVRIQAVERLPAGDLLIVNDTRFVPDQGSLSGCPNPPVGRWPTAAELDTFLFARGGFPWRCYPAGSVSSPGLFEGYSYDTIGTRGLPGGVVPLGVLSRYRHVIWMTDALGATFTNPPTSPTNPITALRSMSRPGQQNLLGAYVAGGGRVWLLGGGCAYAGLADWNKPGNDGASGVVFSNAFGELVPGRMMYDFAHWRSEIRVSRSVLTIDRSLGRFEGGIGPQDRTRGERGPLPYGMLPLGLLPKSAAAGDALPPNRTNPTDFYQTLFSIEYVSQPNAVLEDRNPGPRANLISALDTLYRASGASLVPPTLDPAMTYYHGADNVPVVFSGFDIWSYRRVQCKALVDFVLQRIWGLSTTTVVAAAADPGESPLSRPARH